jgi:hypothetical protein
MVRHNVFLLFKQVFQWKYLTDVHLDLKFWCKLYLDKLGSKIIVCYFVVSPIVYPLKTAHAETILKYFQ